MKVLGIYTSPNRDGLTAAMVQAALRGAEKAGAEVELLRLLDHRIQACRQCGNGWGICRNEGKCEQDDDFQAVRDKVAAADAVVLATPVYFGDLSEATKNFLDRVRRTNIGSEESPTEGRLVLSIAAAGGSGGGGPTALVALERYFGVCQMPVFDALIATRRNREYMEQAAEQAGAAMVRHAQAERARAKQ